MATVDNRIARTLRFPPDLEAALEMARKADGLTFQAEIMLVLKAGMEKRFGPLDGFAEKHPPSQPNRRANKQEEA